MSTDGPRARHRRRIALVAVLGPVTAAVLTLSACSSSGSAPAAGGSSTGSGTAGSGGAGPSATSAAIPTQDVVSGIGDESKPHAELPASVQSSGKLILGTTITPGTSGLPHAGEVNGQNVGLDVDLRNAVAKVLGVSWDVQDGTFATIIPGVQNGKYQVGQDNYGTLNPTPTF